MNQIRIITDTASDITREQAEAMGVSRPTMRLLSRVEGFPVLRIGNRVLFSKKGLERWISEMEGSRVELHER